jgi:hypothetical protein
MNLGSLSETIGTGTRCSLTTSFIYNLAILFTESFIFLGKNKADFIGQSTITEIASLSFFFLGNTGTKFMVMCFYFHWGINKDCNFPASL